MQLETPPPVLIENWLPIEAIGAESKRERGASSALPPLYFLHVWWARRPLMTSRAAILASVLPQWSPDFSTALLERFPNEESYHQWVIHLMGIRGDPAQARKLLEWARQQNTKIKNPYTGARAFTINPSAEDLQLMGDLLEWTWGSRELTVLDPFAGGGSIPFEALRYGFTTVANDLNPVAGVILKATLDYPARFGVLLAEDIRKWGKRWYELVKPKLQPYFTPLPPDAEGAAYLWARTVACPTTGKPVPLSPNWWLRTGENPVAVKMIAEKGMDTPRFEIVTGSRVKTINPDEGTIKRGEARSPWTGETIDGDYIKAEAQAGRMGQMLYAIAMKKTGHFEFRLPTKSDFERVKAAEEELSRNRTRWITKNIIPTEPISETSNYDRGHRMYGIETFDEFFSTRQLLSFILILESLREIQKELLSHFEDNPEWAKAIATYLGLALDIAVDYNCLQSAWHPSRLVIAHVFTKHNFSMTWAFAEFDASANLIPWAVFQVFDAYRKIARLTSVVQQGLNLNAHSSLASQPTIIQGSASDVRSLRTESVESITVDPPYYDNVQYSELSDFFYVWLKRSIGVFYPDFSSDELTNKDDESVANPARFKSMGKKKKELAEKDYELKMGAAFKEMHRVLKPNGVLTVMFTHKKVEAWDTLASALIGAGFTIKASWPVHTESEHSLHQAKKNAAASTILLVCRKRTNGTEDSIWWDDLQARVRETARAKAAEFAAAGIRGVDLYISTFGPTLSIISEHWPVLTSEVDPKTGEPKPLRPETALELAREEVVRLQKQRLLLGRNVQFDPVTDWYIMAWDAFQAEQFPYDEARKLAIAIDVDLDKTIMQHERLVEKKGKFVVMLTPTKRRRKGVVDEEAESFDYLIDAVHTAMMIYDEDGPGACDVFLLKNGLKSDTAFKACLQALLNAIPRTRIKGKFTRREAEILENMRLAWFEDLQAPVELEPELPLATQPGLEGFAEQELEQEEEEEEEEED